MMNINCLIFFISTAFLKNKIVLGIGFLYNDTDQTKVTLMLGTFF